MFDGILATALLAAFIWALRWALPKAVKEGDALALTSTVLMIVVALVAWLLIGQRVESANNGDHREPHATDCCTTIVSVGPAEVVFALRGPIGPWLWAE
jgi:hypothetical protein